MPQSIAGFRIPALAAPIRAREPVPTPPPAPPRGDFEAVLRQAILMASQGNDAKDVAMPMFWKALRAGTTLEDSLRVVDAVMAQGFAFRDLKIAAMNQAMVRVKTRDEAMAVAEALNARGGWTDDWTLGALRKALDLSKTPEECLEVAAFAKDHGRFLRYRDVRNDALDKAGRL
jgi:hypothetical protein